MPAFAGLLERAAVVDTITSEAVYASSNWVTLATAEEPDRHGYLCWDEIEPGGYERRETDLGYIRSAPLWRRLSEAGRRVAVLDVPHTRPEPVNGVMVGEFAAHDRHAQPFSFPPELVDELRARHGSPLGTATHPSYPQFAPCDYAHRAGPRRTPDEHAALLDALRESVAIKGAASLELLRRGGWDLFMTVMGETHSAGHQFWHVHDTTHRHHDPALRRAPRRPCGRPLRARRRRPGRAPRRARPGGHRLRHLRARDDRPARRHPHARPRPRAAGVGARPPRGTARDACRPAGTACAAGAAGAAAAPRGGAAGARAGDGTPGRCQTGRGACSSPPTTPSSAASA